MQQNKIKQCNICFSDSDEIIHYPKLYNYQNCHHYIYICSNCEYTEDAIKKIRQPQNKCEYCEVEANVQEDINYQGKQKEGYQNGIIQVNQESQQQIINRCKLAKESNIITQIQKGVRTITPPKKIIGTIKQIKETGFQKFSNQMQQFYKFQEGAGKLVNARYAAGQTFRGFFDKIGIGIAVFFCAIDIGNDLYYYFQQPKEKRQISNLMTDIAKSVAFNVGLQVSSVSGAMAGSAIGVTIGGPLGAFIGMIIGAVSAGITYQKVSEKYQWFTKSYNSEAELIRDIQKILKDRKIDINNVTLKELEYQKKRAMYQYHPDRVITQWEKETAKKNFQRVTFEFECIINYYKAINKDQFLSDELQQQQQQQQQLLIQQDE